MFKDNYKKTFDDIKPNPYLLSDILNKTTKHKRGVFFGLGIVAAAMVMVISFHSFFTENTKNSLQSEIVMNINSDNLAVNEKAVLRIADQIAEETTASEYFDLVGFPFDKLNIPDSLSPDFSPDTTVNSSGKNTFCYNGDNFLSITISPAADDAIKYLENDSVSLSKFSGHNVAIFHDGTYYRAITLLGGKTSVEVLTDIPEEDLKNLILSITK